MDFKGQLAFMMFLVVVVLGCMGSMAQADGVQPCKYIKVNDIKDGHTECAKCCEANGLVKGATAQSCRCISHYYE